MQSLQLSFSVVLICGVALGCNNDTPGTTTVDTTGTTSMGDGDGDPAGDGDGDSTGDGDGDPSGDGDGDPTGDGDGDPTGDGDGDPTGDGDGDTSGDGDGDTSGDGDGDPTGDGDGDDGLVGFAECPDENADLCPEKDPLCLYMTGAGGFGPDGSFFQTWSACTRSCESDEDCLSDYGPASCVELDNAMICAIDCAFAQPCPNGLSCSQNEEVCANYFCDCTGEACNDQLCTDP